MSLDSKVKEAARSTVGVGDNSSQVPEDFRIQATPPEDIAPYLGRNYAELSTRYEELIASAAEIPDVIENDNDSGKAGDLVKEIRLLDGKLDSARKIEAEPFSKGKSAVDGFFKNFMDPLEKAKKKVVALNTDYLNRKKRAEELRLAQVAQEKRDLAEKLAREAAQAEERKLAAEEAQRTADAAAAEARDNKDELEQGRLDAEAALANAKLKKAKARRDRDEEAFNLASAEVDQCQEALVIAKNKLREARTEQRRLADIATKAAAETRTATTETKSLTGEAEAADKTAGRIERAIEKSSDGDLVSHRSGLGTVNTLARRWTLDITDMQKVHENAQMYIGLIDPDAIRVAIGKRMATGNRDVPGVHYEQVSDARSI